MHSLAFKPANPARGTGSISIPARKIEQGRQGLLPPSRQTQKTSTNKRYACRIYNYSLSGARHRQIDSLAHLPANRSPGVREYFFYVHNLAQQIKGSFHVLKKLYNPYSYGCSPPVEGAFVEVLVAGQWSGLGHSSSVSAAPRLADHLSIRGIFSKQLRVVSGPKLHPVKLTQVCVSERKSFRALGNPYYSHKSLMWQRTQNSRIGWGALPVLLLHPIEHQPRLWNLVHSLQV